MGLLLQSESFKNTYLLPKSIMVKWWCDYFSGMVLQNMVILTTISNEFVKSVTFAEGTQVNISVTMLL